MPTFDQVYFRGTHNSYAGNYDADAEGGIGVRRGINQQLAAGVRSIELDPWRGNFSAVGDYQIGHLAPGDQVWHADGNPPDNRLSSWLDLLAEFCRSVEGHAPLQLILDIKDGSWGDAASAADGNFAALNERLLNRFGGTLVTPEMVRADRWPDIGELMGRVFVVLSGNGASRRDYLIDRGKNPAVATNANGVVVEVHESEKGNNHLWYWVGVRNSSGSIEWRRHGRYGTGTTPAVAINNGGWIVEVHKSDQHDRLWYQSGRLTPDFDIQWLTNADYDDGILPTIRFSSLDSMTLREIHRSQAHDQNWQWNAQLDPSTGGIAWSNNHTTSDPRWPTANASDIVVSTVADNVLSYQTSLVTQPRRIAYQQLAFVEFIAGDDPFFEQGARFAAGDANIDTGFIEAQRSKEPPLLVRAYKFDRRSPRLPVLPNYFSTDHPFAEWYGFYCKGIGTLTT